MAQFDSATVVVVVDCVGERCGSVGSVTAAVVDVTTEVSVAVLVGAGAVVDVAALASSEGSGSAVVAGSVDADRVDADRVDGVGLSSALGALVVAVIGPGVVVPVSLDDELLCPQAVTAALPVRSSAMSAFLGSRGLLLEGGIVRPCCKGRRVCEWDIAPRWMPRP